MKAIVLGIGDELLIGQVINSNAAWISQHLLDYGITTVEHRAIADTAEAIRTALDDTLGQVDLIVCTGGLGPTKDDITKKTLADYFDMKMVFDKALYTRIKTLFASRSILLTEAHREQCYMPESAEILYNGLGTAPGMLFKEKRSAIISLPGVPFEMKYILEHSASSFLGQISSDTRPQYKTIMTSGLGETSIVAKIEDILEHFPDTLSASYLPSFGSVRVRLNDLSGSGDATELNSFTAQISERLGDLVYGYDDESLVSAMAHLLRAQNKTMAVAESCTGGMLGSMITDEVGISDVFAGGVIAYSYDLKKKLLQVESETLLTHGAVSEEVVKEMLSGLLEATGADVGISISGIAGPGGGTPDKPVGTIWIAYGSASDLRSKKIFINRSRTVNRKYATFVALNLLRLFLKRS